MIYRQHMSVFVINKGNSEHAYNYCMRSISDSHDDDVYLDKLQTRGVK
jgi:hypothetical protein